MGFISHQEKLNNGNQSTLTFTNVTIPAHTDDLLCIVSVGFENSLVTSSITVDWFGVTGPNFEQVQYDQAGTGSRIGAGQYIQRLADLPPAGSGYTLRVSASATMSQCCVGITFWDGLDQNVLISAINKDIDANNSAPDPDTITVNIPTADEYVVFTMASHNTSGGATVTNGQQTERTEITSGGNVHSLYDSTAVPNASGNFTSGFNYATSPSRDVIAVMAWPLKIAVEKAWADSGVGADAFAFIGFVKRWSDAGVGADSFLIVGLGKAWADAGVGIDVFNIIQKSIGWSDSGVGSDTFSRSILKIIQKLRGVRKINLSEIDDS